MDIIVVQTSLHHITFVGIFIKNSDTAVLNIYITKNKNNDSQ